MVFVRAVVDQDGNQPMNDDDIPAIVEAAFDNCETVLQPVTDEAARFTGIVKTEAQKKRGSAN